MTDAGAQGRHRCGWAARSGAGAVCRGRRSPVEILGGKFDCSGSRRSLIHTRRPVQPFGRPPPRLGSSCWQRLPSGRWIRWGGREPDGSGWEDAWLQLESPQRPWFSIELAIPAGGCGVEGCQNWPWASWPGFNRGRSRLPPQPCWSLGPEACPGPERREAQRK